MYPRAPSTINHDATPGPAEFTAARTTRARHKENKENASPEPKPTARPKQPYTLRCALHAADTVVLGETLDLPGKHILAFQFCGTDLICVDLGASGVGARAGGDGPHSGKSAGRFRCGQRGYILSCVGGGAPCHRSEVGGKYILVLVNAAERVLCIRSGRKRPDGDIRALVKIAMERLVVEVGLALRDRNGGPHLTFVDPRKNDDAAAMVRNAKRLVALFRARGASRDDIAISIPATEDGVTAAKELAADGIRTNLILVSSLMHAAVCAEAGAATISISVGPLLRAHERKRKAVYQDLAMHPGIEIIQAIVAYFKLNDVRTLVVGRDFRKLAELSALREFDAVCLSGTQLEASRWQAASRLDLENLLDRAPQASMRARQAQHPTTFLEHGTRFMELMSAGARGTVAASMFPALGRMELQMNAIQKLVEAEVAWQLDLKTLSLEALYARQSMPPAGPPAKTRRDRESSQVQPKLGSKKTHKPLEDACERESEGGLIEGVEYF
ncbi:hypothetical protein DFH07DRAFT_811881 [Mycena maculata]|uniref:Transaldolase n=1 Tax=Mycena maculata TaxID=230809 RepID=A0AAD7NKQ9_9AGAR|nr:hypothetical protein DFH07DRAFT_811881 [Mycena maculata]